MRLAADIDWDEAATLTDGFTGAELFALCRCVCARFPSLSYWGSDCWCSEAALCAYRAGRDVTAAADFRTAGAAALASR